MKSISRLLLFGTASSFLLVSTMHAQTCRASVEGSYSFSSLGNGAAGSLMTTSTNTGTGNTNTTGNNTTSTTTYSDTEVGRLLKGLAGTTPFTTAGTLRLEGGIVTASAPSLNMMNVQVGTYTVNSDCTISITLADSFNNPVVGQQFSSSTGTTLQGVVLRNGGEIVLGWFRNAPSTSTGTDTGTNHNNNSTTKPTTVGNVIQSNTIIRLTRTLTGTCSAASLVGSYGLVIQGTGLSNTNTTDNDTTNNVAYITPFFVVATVTFDGAGGVTSSTNMPTSPLSYLRYSGTYTVNSNCTGTMTLTGVPAASDDTTGTGTGTGTGTTTTAAANLTFTFVLTRPLAEVSPSGQAVGAGQAKPGIQITSSSTNRILIGEGFSAEQ